jgi:hypothetical protein
MPYGLSKWIIETVLEGEEIVISRRRNFPITSETPFVHKFSV